mmetsp:Transcript_29789/g.45418  ORF Transcript_29789/g.45418 Transcript_29789/m.45418 type:complete len:135 (+) Transcript_29789:533-937(+)
MDPPRLEKHNMSLKPGGELPTTKTDLAMKRYNSNSTLAMQFPPQRSRFGMGLAKSTADLRKTKSELRRVDSNLNNGKIESPSKVKVTTEFHHSGLGYSPQRRGMLVVPNNAVNNRAIPIQTKQPDPPIEMVHEL